MRWMWHTAALAAAVNQVAAQLASSPSNSTDDLSALKPASLNVSGSSPEYNLFYTSQQAGMPMDALLYAVDTNNLTALPPVNGFVLVPCDPSSYPGTLTIGDTLQLLLQRNPRALLFYSLGSLFCNISSGAAGSVPFYTVASPANGTANATTLLASTNAQGVSANITPGDPNNGNSTGNGSGMGGGISGPWSYGSSATTAVAMIILYSITGIITALFLLIIILGAVRAHRHPERYGPRNTAGRPRQSRARGIARAMLETIPIVKFGEPQPQNKAVDVELQAAAAQPAPADQPAPAKDEPANGAPQSARPPSPSAPAPAPDEEAPMCSICTEEFERGQDTRVLPCRHKFHPACVDPWLLDVSGTCPLCRMDLRDQDAATPANESSPDALAPPLDPAAPDSHAATSSGGRLHALLRRLQPTTAEERIEALRRFREENRHDATAAAEHETRWQRVRRRLRL